MSYTPKYLYNQKIKKKIFFLQERGSMATHCTKTGRFLQNPSALRRMWSWPRPATAAAFSSTQARSRPPLRTTGRVSFPQAGTRLPCPWLRCRGWWLSSPLVVFPRLGAHFVARCGKNRGAGSLAGSLRLSSSFYCFCDVASCRVIVFFFPRCIHFNSVFCCVMHWFVILFLSLMLNFVVLDQICMFSSFL